MYVYLCCVINLPYLGAWNNNSHFNKLAVSDGLNGEDLRTTWCHLEKLNRVMKELCLRWFSHMTDQSMLSDRGSGLKFFILAFSWQHKIASVSNANISIINEMVNAFSSLAPYLTLASPILYSSRHRCHKASSSFKGTCHRIYLLVVSKHL